MAGVRKAASCLVDSRQSSHSSLRQFWGFNIMCCMVDCFSSTIIFGVSNLVQSNIFDIAA
jgi:hypothetical protein